MSTYFMGYYYDRVKRGNGWTVESERLIFLGATKKSAISLVKQLKDDGHQNVLVRRAD